jgi:hypothetical protein
LYQKMAATLTDIQYRVPLWHESMPFVVLWSEKSNCTAAAKWFFFQVGLLEEALEFSPWIHDYEIKVFKTDAYIRRCLAAVNSGIPIIKFVRNPYTRSFSGYLELCRAHPDEPEHWSIPLRRDVVSYLMGTDVEIEYAFSFQQYLEWLRTKDLSSIDLHLAPQFRKFERDLVIEPFHVETGQGGFAAIERRFSLKSSASESHIFESDHYHRKVDVGPKAADAVCKVGIPLQRSKSFQLFEPTITAIAKNTCGEIVRRLFAEDFAAYHYDLVQEADRH